LVEIVLRLAPGLISVTLLGDFNGHVRGGIARQRGLPTSDDQHGVERDDGGPPLRLWNPNARITRPFADEGSVATVVMDENGFPNPPGHWQRESYDVITVGDSFTFSTNVLPESTWPHQLAELTGVTVCNLGKDGIGVHEYVQVLKQYGIGKEPRIVVLNYYEGNDLRDGMRYAEHRKRGGMAPSKARGRDLSPMRWSYSLNLIQASVKALFREEGEEFRYTVLLGDGQRLPINGDNADQDELETAHALVSGEADLHLLDDALESFTTLARTHGFRAIVTYTPSAYTAYDATVVFEDPEVGQVLRDFSRIQRSWMKDAARRFGCELIDLVPGLQAAAKGRECLYFPLNRHFSQAGHRAVAEILAAQLGL
jgi:hypothetical protein